MDTINNIQTIGLAYILERKQIKKDEKNITYYEIIDVDCGFRHHFENTQAHFVSLNKNIGINFPLRYNQSDCYLAVNFESFYDLSKQNNNILDINKFIKQKSESIGELYFHKNDGFYYIKDDEIRNFIENSEKTKKDFDDNVFDKESDISHMYSKIKNTIISQDEQIMQILTTLFKNQIVVNRNFDIDMINKLKESLLIYGPSGTEKTEILKRIAKIYKVPIVIEDSTSLTEAGYIGRKITDMLNDLYLAANQDIELAEKGILVLDEFDKLAEKDNSNTHVSREGVQRSLLKLLDGSDYYFNDLKFNTSKLSIVALGAFTGIAANDDYTNITTKDFVNYGIMRELMGRFSKLVAMNTLNKEDIKKILIESDFSPIHTYKQLFTQMNITFTYEDDFIDYIAEKAIALNSGARSLKTVFDNTITSAMFRIFAGDYSSIHLIKPKQDEKPYILTKKK